jgi:pyruvate/2-oxoglutarate dehydrogenase complex dihydrolipoamide acyltransferase (E2) component
MGFIQTVNVNEGDVVKKGDLLYSIDSKEVDTALAQSDLAISQAELNLRMYQNQYHNDGSAQSSPGRAPFVRDGRPGRGLCGHCPCEDARRFCGQSRGPHGRH